MVCDESGSMEGEPISAINQALPELHQEIGTNPAVCDRARFSLIAFSDDAEVVLDLCDLSDLREMPGLDAAGRTNYSAAFRLTKAAIEQDMKRLKADGHVVHRPVVFFMSDGLPTDEEDWVGPHQELVSPVNRLHPHVVAFGIGQADRAVVAKVATFKAFIQADDAMTPAKALREFMAALTRSIIASASTCSDGPILRVPNMIDGFDSIPLETM